MASKDFQLKTSIVVDSTGMKAGLEAAATATREFATGIKAETSKMSFAFRDVSEMGIGEMRKEMMKLRNVSFAGKTKEEITAINMRIGELMDTMGDLKAVQKGMGVELGTAMAGGLQTLSAMAEAGVGVASMFGASKESAEKYQQVMVSLIGVTQAAGVIEDALATRQLQTIAIRIQQSVVTAAQTVATQAATAAQWLYNASLLVVIGTIGAVVVVVGALVAGLYYVVSGHNSATQAAKDQALAYDMLKKKSDDLNASNEQFIKIEKAKGTSELVLKQYEVGFTKQKLDNLAKVHDSQMEKNGVVKKGMEEEHEATKLQIKETSDLLDVRIAELGTLGKKTTATNTQTTATTAGTEAQKAYNEQLKEYKKLTDSSVTEITQGEINGDKGVSPLASKGINQQSNADLMKERGQAKFGAAIKKSNSELKTQIDAISSINGLMAGFGQAASTAFGEQSAAAKAFAVAQVITSAAMGIMGTWAGYAKFGPWGTALAVAQTAMIGGLAITQLGQIAGAFADGGIVGGNSFSGDQVSARVNSGEMILNGGQQARLFAMANGESQGQNIQIFGRLKAGDIYLSNKRGAYISNRRG